MVQIQAPPRQVARPPAPPDSHALVNSSNECRAVASRESRAEDALRDYQHPLGIGKVIRQLPSFMRALLLFCSAYPTVVQQMQ
jgi:hypothetical protein